VGSGQFPSLPIPDEQYAATGRRLYSDFVGSQSGSSSRMSFGVAVHACQGGNSGISCVTRPMS